MLQALGSHDSTASNGSCGLADHRQRQALPFRRAAGKLSTIDTRWARDHTRASIAARQSDHF
jgi:hypothetical protein